MQQFTESRRAIHPNPPHAFSKTANRPAIDLRPKYPVEEVFTSDCEFAVEEPTGYYYERSAIDEFEREELEFLAQFIQGTAFYIESLEEAIGESLDDFWQAREHAYHIITTYLVLNLNAGL
jgi:hypothetical protein